MKNALVLFALFTLFASCNSAEIETETSEDVSEEQVEDSLEVVEDDLPYYSLEDFFSRELCDTIRQLNEDFYNISSDQDFEAVYTQANRLLDPMMNDLFDYYTSFKDSAYGQNGATYWDGELMLMDLDELEPQMQPVYPDCGAECAGLELYVNFEILEDKAKETSSPADDEFMDIATTLFGYYGDDRYVDYELWNYSFSFEESACSIGDGKVLAVYQKMQDFEGNYPDLFVPQMVKYRKSMAWNMGGESRFVNSKDEVLSELRSILDLNYLSYETSEKIKEWILDIESGDGIDFEYDPGY